MMDPKKRPFSGLLPDDFFSTAAAAPDPDAASSGCRNSLANHNSHTGLHHHHRALSPAPTGRFSLRRSSIVTSSSSSTFRSKLSESKSFFSCVTRQTLPDDCARYRFIAWVAAKRNECQHMNAVDKLECPLLRCRKRFSTHEDLVKHIFDCEHLAGGEYWCFEHLRAERFDDGKCKGCCGHPTRRRKILSMARTFFSNLGHKSKSRKDLGSGDNDGVFLCPPPSYESLHQELSAANEIFELPSPEPVPAQTVSPPELAPEAQTLTIPANFIQPSQVHTEGSQAPLLLVEEEEERELPFASRPSLQLNTLVGNQKPIRPPPAPRSKFLSPSSSVRSTTSTTSTNSTLSTTSSQSLVSPISAWSESSFSLLKGYPLADPSDVLRPEDLVTDSVMADENNLPVPEFSADFGGFPAISELPGDDFTVDLPSEIPDPATMDLSSLGLGNYTYNTEMPSTTGVIDSALFPPRGITRNMEIPPTLAHLNADELFGCSNPKNLIDSAWGTLGEQLSQSINKLKDIENNPLADQMKRLDVKEVAQIGLETLELVFQQGRNPDDPARALCLTHLIYAFSVPVYEKHAMTRYKELFFHSLVYVQGIPEEYRGFYKEVVSVLWQPQDVSEDEVERFLVRQQVESLSRGSSMKGKKLEQPRNADNKRQGLPFVSVAQDFLDDLESAIMFNPAGAPTDMAASDLRELHSRAQGQAQTQASHHNFSLQGLFFQAIQRLVQHYKTLFPNIDGFHDKLDHICQRVMAGRIRSARKAELEVLRAGKCCLDPSLFFDTFIPRARKEVSILYKHQPNNPFPRSTFHLRDIAVVKSIMSGLDDIPTQDMPTDINDWFEDFLTAEAPQQQHEQQQHHQQHQQPSDLHHPNSHSILGGSSLSSPGTMPPFTLPHTSPSPPTSSSFVPATSSAVNMNAFLYPTSDPQQPEYHAPHQSQSPLQPPAQASSSSPTSHVKVESPEVCEICGYRPKGDPRWFQGSMAKHKKTKHSTGPDKVYKCPYPGCQSAYKNREDNLKQHMKEKNHYVTDDLQSRRPSKRKKVS